MALAAWLAHLVLVGDMETIAPLFKVSRNLNFCLYGGHIEELLFLLRTAQCILSRRARGTYVVGLEGNERTLPQDNKAGSPFLLPFDCNTTKKHQRCQRRSTEQRLARSRTFYLQPS